METTSAVPADIETDLEADLGMGSLLWEPCPEARALDGHGLCAGCGWPPDDHADDHAESPDVLAVVIRVPERPALRRAS